jgi:hypothetical protein
VRFVVHLLVAIGFALAVGFGLSYLALTDRAPIGTLRVGPWVAWTEIGSTDPDPYTRARIARQARLELGRSEGIEFVARNDSDGRPLDRNCRYRVDGQTPVARFWTLVAVGADGADIARPGGQRAMRSPTIARPSDGSVEIRVSRTLAPGNWLEITGQGRFRLVLNLYDAAIFSGLASEVERLPAILNEGCS